MNITSHTLKQFLVTFLLPTSLFAQDSLTTSKFFWSRGGEIGGISHKETTQDYEYREPSSDIMAF
jgi:hypothetical protein